MNQRTIERHSINCFECGELVDERECFPNPDKDEGGEICQHCFDKGYDER